MHRFKDAERALRDWQARNPYPRDSETDDIDREWEQASDAVGWPYCDAEEALGRLPAPDLQAVIFKLGLLRKHLDGSDNQRELEERLDWIERDLEQLSSRAGS